MQNIKCIVLLNDIDGAHEKRRESYSMKKMISILLSVALFLSVFPFSVFAATAATDSGYSYYISNEEATIIAVSYTHLKCFLIAVKRFSPAIN